MRAVRLVIFAKAPRSGLAKTRLIPALGADGAADLARRMHIHAVHEALRADIGRVELCVTPSCADDAWPIELRSAGVEWSDQGGGDLGERMDRAARRVIGAGESILLTGTDCPELDAERIRESAQALRHYDATLVPAADGGYALLGLNRWDASIFSNMAWSTSAVAQETLKRAATLGWTVKEQAMVHDIDEPADLKWLPPSLPLPKAHLQSLTTLPG